MVHVSHICNTAYIGHLHCTAVCYNTVSFVHSVQHTCIHAQWMQTCEHSYLAAVH